MKTFAYALGFLLLLGGAVGLINPRFGYDWWERRLRPYFPSFFGQMATEYGRLSDGSLRYIDFWNVVEGALILALASRVRQ